MDECEWTNRELMKLCNIRLSRDGFTSGTVDVISFAALTYCLHDSISAL